MKLKLEDIDSNRPYEGWVEFVHSWIFNEEDRRLFQRHYLDGITYDELAEEFCMDVDTVKSHVYKTRNKLFKHL